MNRYSATIRPAGNLLHEVPRTGLTAPELLILLAIHGPDGITKLVEEPAVEKGKKGAKTGSVSTDEERSRLIAQYGRAVFERTFGTQTYGLQLPLSLKGTPLAALLNGEPVMDEAAA